MNWNELQKRYAVKEGRATASVDTSSVEIDVGKGIKALRIANTNDDPTKVIKISPDGGTKWYDVPAGSERVLGAMPTLHIKGAVADTVYDIEYLQIQ